MDTASFVFLTFIVVILLGQYLYPRDAPQNKRGASGDDHAGRPLVGLESTIGNTPLFKLVALSKATGCEIYAKAEYLNGAGNSPKDRVALSMIDTAEQEGLLKPHSGDVIYEGTVGSTGISLAAICRARGYTAHIIMPSDQSEEKSTLLTYLGANVSRVTPAPITSPSNFINLARARAAAHTADSTKPGRGFFADQFENPANWRAHYTGTGPEIWRQTNGVTDAFVAGAGTGGTMTGVGSFLKENATLAGRQVKCVLADPEGSGLLNRVKFGVMFDPKEREGTRRRQQVDSVVEGIGCNRIVKNFEEGYTKSVVDDAVRVTDAQAMAMARWLVENEGVFAGSSSAVNCFAAARTAFTLKPGSLVVTILCDSGTRHLSKFWAKAGANPEDSNASFQEVMSTT